MKARSALLKNPLAQSLANSMPGTAKVSAEQMAKNIKKTMAQISGLGKRTPARGGHTCGKGGGGRGEHQLEKRQCHACMTDASKVTLSKLGNDAKSAIAVQQSKTLGLRSLG